MNKWNNGSEIEFIALKIAIVLLALCLQKPVPKSKLKDHQDCLAKRLTLWKKGEVDSILREGRMIQRRLGNPRRPTDPPNRAKIFANLVMKGQVNSALRYLSVDQGGGILPLSDDVTEQLKEKHLDPQGIQLGFLLFGPIEDVPDSMYYEINGDMVRDAALRTKGSGGPSGIDANGFRRILTCKSSKRTGTELCEAIASMTKRLCTEYVDPPGLEAILANRLIPLDKGEGAVRPLGVGNVLRRIMGKCVTEPARLFIVGGLELRSSEGTTQGDPPAMSLHAISLQPLITRLQVKSAASQCWYADDAIGCGSLGDVKTWWDELMVSGPPLGYILDPKNAGSL
ncbi:hypothetical protein AWC38_SpisGene2570 [Stylophora pistillata]|uniref:Uncharacterized protein n=1 Tax=Stylophora pistillata TaxID=50429 RepID=A0A2B4SUQ5_STYPI|nr:hypothetical protein AWC38_SpisGene2570 [Stylophora pistillata]